MATSSTACGRFDCFSTSCLLTTALPFALNDLQHGNIIQSTEDYGAADCMYTENATITRNVSL